MPKISCKEASFNEESIKDKHCRYGFQNNFYYIRQILKEKKLQNGRTKIFVSWQGWPESFNSWVYKDTLMPVKQLLKQSNKQKASSQQISDSTSQSRQKRNKGNKRREKPIITLDTEQTPDLNALSINQQGPKKTLNNKRIKKSKQIINLAQTSSQLYECNTSLKSMHQPEKKKENKQEQDCEKIEKKKKTKIDIKAAKILKKRKIYSDEDSQNQLSQTRKLLAKNMQNNDFGYKNRLSQQQKIVPMNKKVNLLQKKKQPQKKKQHKQIQNDEIQINDSYMINIGDVSDIDISKISGDSQMSILYNEKKAQLLSKQIKQQLKIKKPLSKFSLEKRFKINVSKDQNQSAIAENNDLNHSNAKVNVQKNKNNENQLNKSQLNLKPKEFEAQINQFNLSKKEGCLPIVNIFNKITQDDIRTVIDQKQNSQKIIPQNQLQQYESKQEQQNEDKRVNQSVALIQQKKNHENAAETDKNHEIKNQTNFSNESLLLNSLQVTKKAGINVQQSNLLSDLSKILLTSQEVPNQNNTASLLINTTFPSENEERYKKIEQKNQEQSCFILLSKSICEFDDEQKVKYKKQEDVDSETNVEEGIQSKQHQEQKINEKVAYLPDELPSAPAQKNKQEIIDQKKGSQFQNNSIMSYEYQFGQNNKDITKLKRSSKAIDFYFRRQYPELFEHQACPPGSHQNNNKQKCDSKKNIVEKQSQQKKIEQIQQNMSTNQKKRSKKKTNENGWLNNQQKNQSEVKKNKSLTRNKKQFENQKFNQANQDSLEMMDSNILFWQPANDSQEEQNDHGSELESIAIASKRQNRLKQSKKIN